MTTKDRPAVSADTSEQLQQAKEAIASLNTQGGDITELCGEKPGWFVPTYDELSLFLMAITLILLYAMNAPMREQIYNLMVETNHSPYHGHHHGGVYALAAYFLCGLCLSIYHIFTTRETTDFEEKFMLFFAVLTNAGTGIFSGWYVIKTSVVHDWLLVFPIWNVINGVLLLLMLRFRIIDEQCISDRNATVALVAISLASILIIFIFCNFVFHLYWAITYSICIVYTTSFDRALQNVFPSLDYGEDERA
jgi:hypothetical protein